VQELRFSKPDASSSSKKGKKDVVKNRMTDMLKGGYKTDEMEGFWVLDEYEERRAQAMKEMFDGMQMCMKALKEREV